MALSIIVVSLALAQIWLTLTLGLSLFTTICYRFVCLICSPSALRVGGLRSGKPRWFGLGCLGPSVLGIKTGALLMWFSFVLILIVTSGFRLVTTSEIIRFFGRG